MKEILKRYFSATVGLFIVALGVAVSTRSNLGTSPISCPPYVLSLWGGLTMGAYTFCMHLLFIVLQIALLRRRFRAEKLLQLAAAVVFGIFTDLTMWLTAPLQSSMYGWQFTALIAGCIITALGIAVEVASKGWMLAGEETVAAIATVTHRRFGDVKIVFDIVLVAIGAVLAVWLLPSFDGIREGTLIAAVSVGIIIRWIQPAVTRGVQKLFRLPSAA